MSASWEQSLGSLLESQEGDPGGDPLGLELTLAEDPRRLRPPVLLARVVRQGRAGWVNGNLSWSKVRYAGDYDPRHVNLLQETRNVMVYRLIAKGTIEEKVMALKAKKAELFTSVMDDGDVFSSALDADDIRALFAS